MVSSLSFGQALNHLESKQYIYGIMQNSLINFLKLQPTYLEFIGEL